MYRYMAQFDALIIFPLIWSLLFVLFFHYRISIEMLIPDFFGTKKFREKKLDSPVFFSFFTKTSKIDIECSYMGAY